MLVVGGRGLIGGALAEALRSRGHDVVLSTRCGDQGSLALDFSALPDAEALGHALAGFDAVVNAVGVFRAGKQEFDAVHVNAPMRLLAAARVAGVGRFVQLSALGSDPDSPLPYFASKGRFDETVLATHAPEGVVVRPSLVFAPHGASTRWFAMLAVLPLLPLPGGGHQRIQPVHLDDLIAALVGVVEADTAPPILEAVGPRALTLREYLRGIQRVLGASGRIFALPATLRRTVERLVSAWPSAPFDADALRMLEAGSTADATPMAHWRGVPLRDPAGFIAPDAALGLRIAAWLAWLLPLLRWSILGLWLVTAFVSLLAYPRDASLALLAQTGLYDAWARAALWIAALLDLALGLGMLIRRWRPWVYAAQLALIGAYTLTISLALPDQWAHPFGPVSKNLPLLAAVALLWALDREPRPHPR